MPKAAEPYSLDPGFVVLSSRVTYTLTTKTTIQQAMVQVENIAASSNGTTIAGATCEYPGHAPENILTNSLKEYWVTTGMYPQEFIVKLPGLTKVKKVIISSVNGTLH
jgi:hypothetical protein